MDGFAGAIQGRLPARGDFGVRKKINVERANRKYWDVELKKGREGRFANKKRKAERKKNSTTGRGYQAPPKRTSLWTKHVKIGKIKKVKKTNENKMQIGANE